MERRTRHGRGRLPRSRHRRSSPTATLSSSAPPPGDGVEYKGDVGREGGTFEKTRAVLRVPFKATKSGSVTLAGRVSLSVCTDKDCVVDKPELGLVVTVQ